MNDALLEAIVASPDDDAPRLVWADREGGARGELVVIQCALARHDLSREERTRLTAREAELLKNNAYAWSGFNHATFVRGFFERLTVPVDEIRPKVEQVFASAPLLQALRLERLTEDVNAYVGPDAIESWEEGAAKLTDVLSRIPAGRLRSLDVSSRVYETGDWSDPGTPLFFDARLLTLLATQPSLSAMRELVMIDTALKPEHIPAIAGFNLERLQLGSHALNGAGLAKLLRDAPTIVRLAAWAGHPRTNKRELDALLASPDLARLRELDLLSNGLDADDFQKLARCDALANLERLGVGWSHADGISAITRSPNFANLKELDLYGIKNMEAELRSASFVNSLRVLRLPSEKGQDLSFLPALERIEFGG